MPLYKTGPVTTPDLSLDSLSNVSGFDDITAGTYALRRSAITLGFVPDRILPAPLGLGLEYDVDGKLQVKINPLISRIELNTEGLISYPNLYQFNFSKKGVVNGHNLSTGDSEDYSFANYVVPVDSLIVGGSCVATKNKLPVSGSFAAAIIYNGMKTEMVIEKNPSDSSGLVLFDPKILVKSGTRLGITTLSSGSNADCAGYSIFLASLPTITNTVLIRKCTLPISTATVVNPTPAIDIVSIDQVPMTPV